jgi:hypothetical protein
MNPRPETTEQKEGRVNIAWIDDLKKALLAAVRICHHVNGGDHREVELAILSIFLQDHLTAERCQTLASVCSLGGAVWQKRADRGCRTCHARQSLPDRHA